MTTVTQVRPQGGPGWLTKTLHLLVESFKKVGTTLLLWQERYEQRRQLLRLSEHLLKDLNLSRADVEREAGKPFWRA